MPIKKSLAGIRKHITSALIDLGLYETADDHMIELTAQTLKTTYDAYKLLGQNGFTQTFKNKTRQVSPEWTVYNKCVDQYMSLAKELGLSPKARRDLQAQIMKGGPAPGASGLNGLRKQ